MEAKHGWGAQILRRMEITVSLLKCFLRVETKVVGTGYTEEWGKLSGGSRTDGQIRSWTRDGVEWVKMARGHKGLSHWWMGMSCIGWEAGKRVMISGKDQEFIWGHVMFPNCSPTLDSRPPYVFTGMDLSKGHGLLATVEKCDAEWICSTILMASGHKMLRNTLVRFSLF